ncbi:MAG: nodulation protein NfeD [Bacteroidetes bacterium]|nr:MAG: nodulation protein NfeD [Bacteroidota bacterium]
MKSKIPIFITAILFTFVFGFNAVGQVDDSASSSYKIYTFNIHEMIAPPVWRTTKLAIENAEEENADLILIHMNTYGGMLDAADSIRTKILNTDIPIYVFIDKNAASAGALISIACDSIYMASGSSIGAATVVNQEGKQMPDKYQSYMRSMMRATAEAKNRDPDIAQAMVDPKIYVESISDTGQVLTFTVSEAIEFGFCEGEASSLEEALELAGIEDYIFVKHEISATDKIIGWLINPMVSGILIMVIIGGIYFELQTPGIGFPLAAAAIAATLYFAPLYLEGLANHWEIMLFIVGLVLIAIEIFAIPGFGIAGVLGIAFTITGLTLSMVQNMGTGIFDYDLTNVVKAFFVVVIAFFLSIVGSIILTKQLFGTTHFGNLALAKTQKTDEGYTSASSAYQNMQGQEGIARTILRPTGKVSIDGDQYDATALTGFIEKGVKIIVVGYQTGQLVVKKK